MAYSGRTIISVSCVANTTCLLYPNRALATCAVPISSKPLVGSSATIAAGEKLNAEAMASRCRFSESSAEAGCRETSASPKWANRLPMIACRSDSGTLCFFSGSSMASAMVAAL